MLLLIKPDAFSDDQHNSSVEVCIQCGHGFKGLKLGDWFAPFSLFLYCTLHFSLFLFCMLDFSLFLFCTLGFSIFLFCMLRFTLLLFCMHSFSLSLQLEQQKKVHCHNFTELKKQQTYWQRTWHLYFYFLHSVNLFCYAPNFSALFALLELCWTLAIVWKALWFGSNKKSCCHNSGGPDALLQKQCWCNGEIWKGGKMCSKDQGQTKPLAMDHLKESVFNSLTKIFFVCFWRRHWFWLLTKQVTGRKMIAPGWLGTMCAAELDLHTNKLAKLGRCLSRVSQVLRPTSYDFMSCQKWSSMVWVE